MKSRFEDMDNRKRTDNPIGLGFVRPASFFVERTKLIFVVSVNEESR